MNLDNVNMKPKTVIILGAVLLALVLFFSIQYFAQRSQMTAIVGQLTTDKESLESEYQKMMVDLDSLTTDNNRISLNNDSLFFQLESQQHKISQLMDQLKMVNATNTAKINEYKKELATMREVLKSYVKQIDELNKENTQLKQENKTYKEKVEVTTTQVVQLQQQTQVQAEKINIGSTLVTSGYVVEMLTDHDRKARRISKLAKVKISFTIARNIMADPGVKQIYMRIVKPDGETANEQPGNTFDFENAQVSFTSKKEIEYSGEELPMYLVWNVTELIYPGKYRALFVADGKQIGETTFSLDK